MSGRRVFVSGEILTAANVQSFLQDQAVMVFDDAANRSAAIPSPIEGMVTYRKDVGGAAGVEVYDGSGWGPVGRVVQVLQGTRTSAFSTTSTSYVDAGVSVTITPTSTSSKILVMFDTTIGNNVAFSITWLRLMRDSTSIFTGDAAGSRVLATSKYQASNASISEQVGGQFLDSPNTTSAVTYKLQIAAQTSTATLNRDGNDPDATSAGRYPSSITVLEVAG